MLPEGAKGKRSRKVQTRRRILDRRGEAERMAGGLPTKTLDLMTLAM